MHVVMNVQAVQRRSLAEPLLLTGREGLVQTWLFVYTVRVIQREVWGLEAQYSTRLRLLLLSRCITATVRKHHVRMIQRTFAANQSDFRKRVTSRNTPTRTYLLQEFSGEVYLKFCHGSSLLTSPFTVQSLYCTRTIHVYVYCRQRIHTYSFMGSRIRDSAAAVHVHAQ